MKYQQLIFLMGLVLLVASSTAVPMAVSINSATVTSGSTAVIPVKVTGASNLAAMDLVITYDPAVLQFSSADLGEISTNGMIETNTGTPGTVKIGLVDTKGISGDGTLISMSYKVAGSSGSSSQVTPEVSGAWTIDLIDIQTTTSGGSITVGGGGGGGSIPLSTVTVLGALCMAGVFIGIYLRKKE